SKRRARALVFEAVQRGYAVCSIGYRLSGEDKFPACVRDCRAALRWVRANAARYAADPERIALMGSSAGGHLAALMAVCDDAAFRTPEFPDVGHTVAAVVARYGVFDLRDAGNGMSGALVRGLIGAAESERPDAYRRASPLWYVESAAAGGAAPRRYPPFLFIHGERDRVVSIEQSRRMHAALRSAGCVSTLIEVRGGGHGLLLGEMDPSPEAFRDQIFTFLDQHLK
ncbi:MAG: alpha/beta hydrolase, partial [Phycisphaerae bacterium]